MSEPPAAGEAPVRPAPPPRFLPGLVLSFLTIYALSVLIPLVNAGRLNALLSVLATLLFTALAVVLIAYLARWPLTLPGELIALLVAVTLWPLLQRAAAHGDLWRLYCFPLVNLAFMFLCVMGGRLLSRILREPNILLPVCLVAGLADIFTVFLGPTGKALQAAPELVQKFSVSLPQAGSAAGPHGAAGLAMLASMGVGDFVFLALFLTAAARFGFPLRRGGRLIATLLCLALAAYFLLPLFRVDLPGIPLLPFIAGGFLLAYGNRFHLTGAEKQGLIWGGLFLVILLGGAGWAMHRPAPPAPQKAPSTPSAPAAPEAPAP